MKKIITLFILFCISQSMTQASYIDKQIKDTKNNDKYGTVKYHQKAEQNILTFPQFNNSYKDPQLIKLPNSQQINATAYNEKIKADNVIYETKIKKSIYKKSNSINIEPAPVDFYNVYRICERLIRANNLDYVNWRIAIRKSEDFNASTFEGNAIRIHTGLYDTLYNNDDALAFIFAHEMAHQLMGHAQRKLELETKRQRLNGDNPDTIATLILKQIERRQSKTMEFMADAEAIRLLITAGYNPQNAMNALTFMEALPNVDTFWKSHPVPAKRIANVQEYAKYANPYWTNIGKANIYSSEVLKCKKSSDRVSIVICKNLNIKNYYELESQESCLTRIAYISYKTGDMKNAVKYFDKLATLKKDYASYLYLSYANEYLYEQTKEEKYHKAASDAIKKANELSGNSNKL